MLRIQKPPFERIKGEREAFFKNNVILPKKEGPLDTDAKRTSKDYNKDTYEENSNRLGVALNMSKYCLIFPQKH